MPDEGPIDGIRQRNTPEQPRPEPVDVRLRLRPVHLDPVQVESTTQLDDPFERLVPEDTHRLSTTHAPNPRDRLGIERPWRSRDKDKTHEIGPGIRRRPGILGSHQATDLDQHPFHALTLPSPHENNHLDRPNPNLPSAGRQWLTTLGPLLQRCVRVYHAYMEMSRNAFEQAVAEAMDLVPFAFAELMENVVIQVRDEPTRGMIESVGLDPARSTLFGLYSGVSLDRRGGGYGNVLPDAIFIFRKPLLAACRTRSQVIRQIQLTLLHEIGHHLGFSDTQMHAWEDAFAMIVPGQVV